MKLDELKELLDLDESKETNKIQNILPKFTRYWKWFIVSVIVCMAAGGLYSLTQVPVYRISSAILIKEKDGQSSFSSQMDFMKNMDFLGGKDNVLDEIQVLNSKTLLRKVVTELKLHTTYYKHSKLKQTEIYKNSPIHVSMLPQTLDTLTTPITLHFNFTPDGIELKGEINESRLENYEFQQKLKSLPAIVETPNGIIRISQDSVIPIPKIGTISVILSNTNETVSELKKAISIDLIDRKANAISLTIPSSVIPKGKEIISKLIQYYNEASIEEKNQVALNSIKFIDDRLSLITGELSTVERNVENYKQANKLTNIEAESEEFIKQNSDFDRQRLETETQLNLVEFVSQYIRKEDNRYGTVPNIGITDEALAGVLREYNTLLFQRERLIRSTSEKNPVIIDIERQIRSIRDAILSSVENTKRGLMIRKRDLDYQYTRITSRIKDVPRQEREFVEIKRQQELKAALYTYLLQKREENNLALALAVPTAKVIDEPLLDQQISAGMNFYLMIAFILGLIIPAIIIYLRDILNKRITDKTQLEGLTKVSILGELPDYKGKESIVVKPDSREPITEMYRLIRTNLQFIMHDKSKKVINITSTEPGEGKTTFTINMALTLAMTGKKILIAGLDIRKPALSDFLTSPQKTGITTYLSELNLDYANLVQSTLLHENLFILPSGPVPPNPNELLLKTSLDELFILLRKEFDYILVDTAPVGVVADTFLLDRITDVTLYIFRANFSNKNNAKIINDIAKHEKLRNLYIVLKGCDTYSHVYGYGKKKYGYYSLPNK